jgi:hypothetical protein
MPGIDLGGAIDVHVHFGPDPHRRRSVTALEAARQAKAAGHAGLVFKHHEYPTSALAALVADLVPGIEVFGGLCCDAEVGGVNVEAVRSALDNNARIVWLPTHSARVVDPGSAATDVHGGSVETLDEDGRLSAATGQVIDLVAERGAVLATGHTSRATHFAVVAAMAGRAPVLVTHAREAHCQPDLSLEDVQALAEADAMIEFSAITCVGRFACRPLGEIAAAVRACGVERCVISTDLGQRGNPTPVEGLRLFADGLLAAGFAEEEVHMMAITNPARLVRASSAAG